MAKKVDNRNLVVVDTFDEFANKVDKLDFEVEDIVALVTSLANTFYWLNVESVWGPIGFTWKKTDDYGVFNKTTIPFSVIPKLPDGYRIKSLSNTFNNVSSAYIDLRKSDWRNLTSVNGLCPPGKKMTADLTGAPIEGVITNLIGNNAGELYVKGDFSRVTELSGNTFGGYTIYSFKDSSKLIVDDGNKYLNMPYKNPSRNINGVYYWKGDGPLRLEYTFRIDPTDYVMKNLLLYSRNLQYYITNLDNLGASLFGSILYGNNNDVMNEPFTEVTIDTRYSRDVDIISILYNSTNPNVKAYTHKLRPLRFVGKLDSINAYNPNLYIVDEFPPYDEEQMSALVSEAPNHMSLIMPYIVFENLVKCPYVIDMAGKNTLRLFKGYDWNGEKYPLIPLTREKIMGLGGVDLEGDGRYYVIDILPKLINADHEFKFAEFFGASPNCEGGIIAKYKIPSFRAQEFYANGFYIDNDTVIQFSNKGDWTNYTDSWLGDCSKTHIVLFPDDNGRIHFTGAGIFPFHWTNNMVMNYIEVETRDSVILKSSTINTVYEIMLTQSNNYTGHIIKHPVIITNSSFSAPKSKIIIESDFVFIYASNISFVNYNDSNPDWRTSMEDIRKFIAGIQVNDTNKKYNLTLKSNYYNQLTEEEKNHIINDLNYVLVNQI